MRKTFYIFRHGETDHNKNGLFQGQNVDAKLNGTGIFQAIELSKKMKRIDFDIIASSPLNRAHETAKIVSKATGKDIILIDDLKEVCIGIMEGMDKRKVSVLYPNEYRIWRDPDSDLNFKFEGGESRKEAAIRFFDVLTHLTQSPHKSFAVSTHGRITSSLLLHLGIKKTRIENCEIIQLTHESGEWVCSCVQDK